MEEIIRIKSYLKRNYLDKEIRVEQDSSGDNYYSISFNNTLLLEGPIEELEGIIDGFKTVIEVARKEHNGVS